MLPSLLLLPLWQMRHSYNTHTHTHIRFYSCLHSPLFFTSIFYRRSSAPSLYLPFFMCVRVRLLGVASTPGRSRSRLILFSPSTAATNAPPRNIACLHHPHLRCSFRCIRWVPLSGADFLCTCFPPLLLFRREPLTLLLQITTVTSSFAELGQ
jgi:hypothetical protein